jgi:DNA-binding transcriptional MerR regulator
VGDGSYSVEDLERLLGLKGRTIHYWTQEGLFEGPGAGRGARYTDEHLVKLFLILKLREEGRSLAEIKTALKRLPTRALKAWVDMAKAEPPKETATAKELITRWLKDSHKPDVRAAWRLGISRHSSQPSLWSGLEAAVRPGHWERVSLAPDVELHLQHPLSPASRTLVDQLLALSKRLSQKDTP